MRDDRRSIQKDSNQKEEIRRSEGLEPGGNGKRNSLSPAFRFEY